MRLKSLNFIGVNFEDLLYSYFRQKYDLARFSVEYTFTICFFSIIFECKSRVILC